MGDVGVADAGAADVVAVHLPWRRMSEMPMWGTFLVFTRTVDGEGFMEQMTFRWKHGAALRKKRLQYAEAWSPLPEAPPWA